MIRSSRKRLSIAIASAALLLQVGYATTGFGAVRFDVIGAPTEVINTGRSEVVGSITLAVRGSGNVTGTAAGGATQIGLVFGNPALQIDNTVDSGIRLISSPGFAAADPTIIAVENREINGRCTGFLSINLLPGATLAEGDFIRIEGVRGRIDASSAITPGVDLFVDLQSINDPAANSFAPDRIRVAKSLRGLDASVLFDDLSFSVRIAEAFARAFIDNDANDDGVNFNDRTDSTGAALGAPTNSTQFNVRLEGIPSGITSVVWPATSTVASTGSALHLVSSTFSEGVATAVYRFEALDQVNRSDVAVESFSISPAFIFTAGKCNTDELTASVTLAPAVPAQSGCGAPSSDLLRPRFLEQFELNVTSLTPSSAVAGAEGVTLTVRGAGFAPGATVLWNGESRPTTFVSNSRLTAAISATDLLEVGTASVAVANPPALGGTVSRPLTFTLRAPALALYYPRLIGRDSGTEGGEFTGIALANISGRTATLKLKAFDAEGNLISGAGVTNPASLTLAAGQQRPLVESQIFGDAFRAAGGKSGWLEVEGDVAQIAGFFLDFTGSLSRLDGADVSGKAMTSFIAPQLEADGISEIHVANPNHAAAGVQFDLVSSEGVTVASSSRVVSASGLAVASLSELFPAVQIRASDYLRSTSSHPVASFLYMLRSKADSAGLNGQDAGAGASTLYSPQYVVGGRDWASELSVINLSGRAGNVSFRFLGDDGTQIGETRILPIGARGKILVTDQAFFLDTSETQRQGYVEIAGSAELKLTGSVSFGGRGGRAFYSALPLIAGVQADMIFGQVASNGTFFTGLALFNPGDEPADAVIQVFDSNGAVVASKAHTIGPKSRSVGLLTELFPELSGRDLSSGYVNVSSFRGLAGFALFGTRDLTVLSAVPAQTVR
jgi:hypothetical protein